MKYQKKVEYVDAERFSAADSQIPEGVQLPIGGENKWGINLNMGWIPLSDGDMIVTYSNGKRVVMKQPEFNRYYEECDVVVIPPTEEEILKMLTDSRTLRVVIPSRH